MSEVGYLGLGSNVGDRAAHLRAAVEMLPEHGVEVVAVSSTYETEPVGEILDQLVAATLLQILGSDRVGDREQPVQRFEQRVVVPG